MTRSGTRTAVTCTLDVLSPWLPDWIEHHKKHFDQIYLWIDDPRQLHAAIAFEEERVFVDLGAQIEGDSLLNNLMRRLEENANSGIRRARKAGIDWILHIDSDELFVPLKPDVWETSAGELCFQNHECCPLWSADRPFREVEYFKIAGKLDFNLYDGQKAAARCTPGLSSFGCHHFRDYAGKSIKTADACILHFACCTFQIWFEKYLKLGQFSDFWYDDEEQPIQLGFHKASRDVVRQYLETGNLSVCHDFYLDHMHDEEQLLQLQAEGKVFRWHWGKTPDFEAPGTVDQGRI